MSSSKSKYYSKRVYKSLFLSCFFFDKRKINEKRKKEKVAFDEKSSFRYDWLSANIGVPKLTATESSYFALIHTRSRYNRDIWPRADSESK